MPFAIHTLLIEDDPLIISKVREEFADTANLRLDVRFSLGEAATLLQKHDDLLILQGISGDPSRADEQIQNLRVSVKGHPVVLLAPEKMRKFAAESLGGPILEYQIKDDGWDGRLTRLILLMAELQERRRQLCRTSIRRKDSSSNFRQVVNHNIDGVIVVDRKGTILFSNPTAKEMFSRRNKSLTGEFFGHPLVTGETAELNIPAPDGSSRTVEMRISEMVWNEEPAFVASLRDISDRKQMEDALSEAKEAAERANRAKSDYLARMSHEIRTPMSGILGMTDLVLATNLSSQQKKYLEITRNSANSLLTIINDILDLSKIESGKFELEVTEFSLKETLEPLFQIFQNLAEQKFVRLRSSISSDIPDALVGDPGRLKQVIYNLVGNAVKFTNTGFIYVTVDLAPGKPVAERCEFYESHLMLEFTVRDTGIGISEAFQKVIFDSFTREEADMRPSEGTGLGLSIAKQLVSLMGGELTMTSTPGRGSTFSFTVCFGSASKTRMTESNARKEQAESSKRKPTGNLNILLVEDNQVNRMFAREFLSADGHRITTAIDGSEALGILSEKDFDLVLMDIQMPGMDGLEATKRIRSGESGVRNPNIPIIALTAHAIKGDRERFLHEGMNEYVTKPIDFSVLYRAISDVLENVRSKAAAEMPVSVEEAVSADSTPNADDVINSAWFDQMVAKRRNFVVRMFEVYTREEPKRLELLRQAFDQGDMDKLAYQAHSIKGASATLGATSAREAAAEVETAARAGDTKRAEKGILQLEQEMDRLLRFMTSFMNEKN